jgi:hypothetical protein
VYGVSTTQNDKVEKNGKRPTLQTMENPTGTMATVYPISMATHHLKTPIAPWLPTKLHTNLPEKVITRIGEINAETSKHQKWP